MNVVTSIVFYFNDTAPTEIYTLSYTTLFRSSCGEPAHDAAPPRPAANAGRKAAERPKAAGAALRDRKSTRLNSSHSQISYAVFCLKKKNMPPSIISYEV